MSRELLQQALNALEEAAVYTSSPSWSPSMTEECTAVAASIRAHLAQPAPAKPVPPGYVLVERMPEHDAPFNVVQHWNHGYATGWNACLDAMIAASPQPAPVPDIVNPISPALVPVPLTQCNTNDSPWLICKTCAAVGRCAQACGTKPLSLDFIDRHIGPDEGDREAVIEIVRQVEAAHGIAASQEKP
jgi:hypothetical protein